MGMNKKPHNILLLCLLLPSMLQGIHAIDYIVKNTEPNTLGGKRFDADIGIPFTVKLMGTINQFIWKVFNQTSAAQRKNVPSVGVYIKNLNDGAEGEIGGNAVYVSTRALQSYPPGNGARTAFTALLYHEMTHVFQWSGEGSAPGGLTEGIADYVALKAGAYDPNGYTKPGEGSKWDEGYGITARFLEYCDSLKAGFTAMLNDKMRKVYKDEYFRDLLGKPLDQVWREYKAKYSKHAVTN